MPPHVKFRSDREPGVDLAVFAAGSEAALARYLGITRAAVSQWRRVPVEHVLNIEARYGLLRWELRPDIYPREALVRSKIAD